MIPISPNAITQKFIPFSNSVNTTATAPIVTTIRNKVKYPIGKSVNANKSNKAQKNNSCLI
jgi:hypothetical protein